jgi:hypothetical protein
MRNVSSETWAGDVLLMTCGLLMLTAIVAACVGRRWRPRFLGCAMFGWGYFALARWYTSHEGPLSTVRFLPGSGDFHGAFLSLPPVVRMAHDAWALAFALLGSILAGLLFPHSAAGEVMIAESAPPHEDEPAWWRKPAWVGTLGLGLVMATAMAGWRRDARIAAGAMFLLTWALLGLAVLGAVFGAGRRREAWFGAVAFGLGYMFLAFGPVVATGLPTNHLLNAVLRRDGQKAPDEWSTDELAGDEASRRLVKALEAPISLHFPENTPLKTVLEPIRERIRGSLGRDPVIYVARSELGLAPERFGSFLVKIDRDNITMSEALRLCLAPLGLTYRVQSGYVRIQANGYQPIPIENDPVMIAGHSLLAILAAAVGGVAAPIVSRRFGRQPLAG